MASHTLPVTLVEGHEPWFEIKGNGIYTTAHHPNGPSDWAWFEIRNGNVYTTYNHPQGRVSLPWYEIHDDIMYATRSHPDGYAGMPLFVIRGNLIYGIVRYSPVRTTADEGEDQRYIEADSKRLGKPESD